MADKTKICRVLADGSWSGEVREIDVTAPCPAGWVFSDPPSVPAGKKAYQLADGWAVIDPLPTFLPPEPEVPVVRQVTYKADIARRCTEEEATKLRALLDATDDKFYLLYTGVQQIEHDSPEFPTLYGALVQTIGQERTDIVLAPSVG